MKEIGNVKRLETGRHLNNRAENSHQPFRRRERAMSRLRRMRSLQKFAYAHSSVHNHFDMERHLYSRSTFKAQGGSLLDENLGSLLSRNQHHLRLRRPERLRPPARDKSRSRAASVRWIPPRTFLRLARANQGQNSTRSLLRE